MKKLTSVLLSTFLISSSISTVAAYSVPNEFINYPSRIVKEYVNSGMSKDEILDQMDSDAEISVSLTVKNVYIDEVEEFCKKNVRAMKGFSKNTGDSELSSCNMSIKIGVLKEMMSKKWYYSFEFDISDVKTVEEIKTNKIEAFYSNMSEVNSDTVILTVHWNVEMEKEEMLNYLTPKTVIDYDDFDYVDSIHITTLSVPKNEVEKYIEIYKDDNKEYVITNIYCHVPEKEIPTSSEENNVLGDINFDGKADLTDLTELSLVLVGDSELTAVQQKAADVDGDGEVKLADLAKFKQFLSKQISSLG